MKRYIALLLLVMIALGLSGCREEVSTPDTYVPSVMYDGDIYCTTGKQVPGEVAEDSDRNNEKCWRLNPDIFLLK